MLSLRFDLLVMFLKFLEKIQELVLFFNNVGRNRVNSAEIKAKEKALEIETQYIVDDIWRSRC